MIDELFDNNQPIERVMVDKKRNLLFREVKSSQNSNWNLNLSLSLALSPELSQCATIIHDENRQTHDQLADEQSSHTLPKYHRK